MLDSFRAKVLQGDRVVLMLEKTKYNTSIQENEVLSAMISEKAYKDLKKGDRIILPSLAIFHDLETDLEIDDGDLFAEDDSDFGFVVFEIKVVTQKAKGVSISVTLTSIEVCKSEDWESRAGFALNEEMQMAIPDTKKSAKVYALDESVPRTGAKKEEAKSITIGKKHLQMFGDMELTAEDSTSKGGNRATRQAIRKTLSYIRKAEESLHSEVVVTEGGFKQNCSYLDRIAAAHRDHLGLTGGVTKEEGKWIGVSGFARISGLRLMKNKEAFQEFIVNGTWDKNKYGHLLNQFLSEDERVNDNSVEQLTSIMRSSQSILKVSYGLVWQEVMGVIISKLENGELAVVNTPQVKATIEETWEVCNRTLREDENMVTWTLSEVTKSYKLDNISNVVEMYKDRFSSIPETTYVTGELFRKQIEAQHSLVSEKVGNQLSGKKRDKEDGDGFSAPRKLQGTGTGQSKQLGIVPLSRAQKKEFVRDGEKKTGNSEIEYLCLFDLKHQLLRGVRIGCKKGRDCERHHFDRSLFKTPDYYWTAERMQVQVVKTKVGVVMDEKEKESLIKVLKDLA